MARRGYNRQRRKRALLRELEVLWGIFPDDLRAMGMEGDGNFGNRGEHHV